MAVTELRSSDHARGHGRRSAVRRVVLAIFVLAVVLSPHVTVQAGFYKPRGEDFVLLGVVAAWILALPTKRLSGQPLLNQLPGNLRMTKILGAMFGSAVVSIGAGTVAFRQPLIFRDWMILPMIARCWLAFQVGQWVREDGDRRLLVWVLIAGLGMSALVGILQHFNWAGVNEWLTPLYVVDHTRVVGLELVKEGSLTGRVLGTQGDPRFYAYMMVVGVGVSLGVLSNFRRVPIQVGAVVMLALCLTAMAFAASRTAVLAAIGVWLAVSAVQLARPRGGARVIGLLFALVTVIALLSHALTFATFQERVMNLRTTSFDYRRSFRGRIRDMKIPVQSALDRPLIWLTGRGPSKAVMRTSSHTDFGWYFHRFGLPGLLLYLLLIAHGAMLSWRGWRDCEGALGRATSTASLAVVVTWFVFAMANAIMKDPQLMALNMLLLGACVRVRRVDERCP